MPIFKRPRGCCSNASTAAPWQRVSEDLVPAIDAQRGSEIGSRQLAPKQRMSQRHHALQFWLAMSVGPRHDTFWDVWWTVLRCRPQRHSNRCNRPCPATPVPSVRRVSGTSIVGSAASISGSSHHEPPVPLTRNTVMSVTDLTAEPGVAAAPTVVPPRGVTAGTWARVALVCVLLAASGGVRWWQARRFQALSEAWKESPFPLEELPLSIGPWRGEAVQMDEQIARATGATDHILRRYVNQTTGVKVDVIVLYGPATSVFIHRPETCYPSAGFEMADAPTAHTVEAGALHAPFRALVYVRGEGGQTEPPGGVLLLAVQRTLVPRRRHLQATGTDSRHVQSPSVAERHRSREARCRQPVRVAPASAPAPISNRARTAGLEAVAVFLIPWRRVAPRSNPRKFSVMDNPERSDGYIPARASHNPPAVPANPAEFDDDYAYATPMPVLAARSSPPAWPGAPGGGTGGRRSSSGPSARRGSSRWPITGSKPGFVQLPLSSGSIRPRTSSTSRTTTRPPSSSTAPARSRSSRAPTSSASPWRNMPNCSTIRSSKAQTPRTPKG